MDTPVKRLTDAIHRIRFDQFKIDIDAFTKACNGEDPISIVAELGGPITNDVIESHDITPSRFAKWQETAHMKPVLSRHNGTNLDPRSPVRAIGYVNKIGTHEKTGLAYGELKIIPAVYRKIQNLSDGNPLYVSCTDYTIDDNSGLDLHTLMEISLIYNSKTLPPCRPVRTRSRVLNMTTLDALDAVLSAPTSDPPIDIANDLIAFIPEKYKDAAEDNAKAYAEHLQGAPQAFQKELVMNMLREIRKGKEAAVDKPDSSTKSGYVDPSIVTAILRGLLPKDTDTTAIQQQVAADPVLCGRDAIQVCAKFGMLIADKWRSTTPDMRTPAGGSDYVPVTSQQSSNNAARPPSEYNNPFTANDVYIPRGRL